MPGQISYCTTDSIPIDLMFQEKFPTHTLVLNRLSHRNELPIGATIATRTMSGTSVIRRSSVPPRECVGPTTDLSQPETVAKSKAATP